MGPVPVSGLRERERPAGVVSFVVAADNPIEYVCVLLAGPLA